jgi:hypothetical protein
MDQHIVVSPNTAEEMDYVGIAGHNFGSGQIPVSIEGAAVLDSDGFPDWFELVADSIPENDAPLLFRFESQTLLALRIRLQPGQADPQAAVVYVGRLLTLPRRIYVGHKPLPFNRTANIVTGRSELGQFLGRILLAEMTSSQISMANVPPAIYRTQIEPWLKAAVTRPFFFAWRPFTYPKEVGYCWAAGDSQMNNALQNGFVQFSLDLQGIHE